MKFVFNRSRDTIFRGFYPDYAHDGNASMYSILNLAKRKALRENIWVKRGINDLVREFKLDGQGNCSKDVFVDVYMKIGNALKPAI